MRWSSVVLERTRADLDARFRRQATGRWVTPLGVRVAADTAGRRQVAGQRRAQLVGNTRLGSGSCFRVATVVVCAKTNRGRKTTGAAGLPDDGCSWAVGRGGGWPGGSSRQAWLGGGRHRVTATACQPRGRWRWRSDAGRERREVAATL